jgi:hypothetical protein
MNLYLNNFSVVKRSTLDFIPQEQLGATLSPLAAECD